MLDACKMSWPQSSLTTLLIIRSPPQSQVPDWLCSLMHPGAPGCKLAPLPIQSVPTSFSFLAALSCSSSTCNLLTSA